MIEDLPRQKVVLDSELLNFKVRAQDDYGVRRVGLEWQGIDPKVVKSIATGERALAPGGPDKELLEVAGAFSAKSFGIEPQPIALRVFVEDYLPGRPRVVSPPYTLYILSAEQHAIWLTEQLSKWHRQSLEVRDREMQLYETNKQLRAMAPEDLDRPDVRKKIEAQSQAEKANGRRLSGLVMNGEDLVKQAMRNPEFGVGHLERWAEMLQILKDISANRMPSVADLLKQAAQAEKALAVTPSNNAPMAGNIRSGGSPKPSEPPPAGAPKPPTQVPSIVDRESSQQPPDNKEEKPGPGSAPKTPRLLLPTTTLTGGVKPGEGDPPPPAAQKVDEALTAQRDLLAEFEKVADELNRILANLEGSTLVKRLKAASRLQSTVAGKITDQVADAFGVSTPRPTASTAKALEGLAEQEAKGSHTISVIMDDMSAYFERRRYVRFKTVLEEMRQKDVIGAIRQLGDDLKREQGVSIAQAEYWSDTLDRWAEDLVDPTRSGACPGSKSRSSLPPSIVLEVLQILEGEVNLREETRVAEQAKPALAAEEFGKQAETLSKTQDGLKDRTEKVTERIQGAARRLRGRVRSGDPSPDPGGRRHGRGDRHPGLEGHRRPGHRGGDRGDRAAAPVEADQPQGRRGRRLFARRRRSMGRHQGFGAGVAGQRPEPEGSPRRPGHVAGDGRFRAGPAGRIPLGPRSILQQARSRPRRQMTGGDPGELEGIVMDHFRKTLGQVAAAAGVATSLLTSTLVLARPTQAGLLRRRARRRCRSRSSRSKKQEAPAPAKGRVENHHGRPGAP